MPTTDSDPPKKKTALRSLRKGVVRFLGASSKKPKRKTSADAVDGVAVPEEKIEDEPSPPQQPSRLTSELLYGASHGRVVPAELAGLSFAFEVVGYDEGWFLDLSAATCVVTRFPSGHAPLNTTAWRQYRSEEIWALIESGQLTEISAVESERLSVSGGRESLAALDALDEFWREIKVEIMLARQPEVMIADTTERYKSPFERAGGNAGADELETSLAGEDWDEEEEEKLIRASRAPRHEPWHPFSRKFWIRHVGTDALVGSWLFLLSSVLYVYYAVVLVERALYGDKSRAYIWAAWVNAVSALGFLVGCFFFIKHSYPETNALSTSRALRMNTRRVNCVERYFTANELLLAMWCFELAFLPYLVLGCFYLATGNYVGGAVWVAGPACVMSLLSIWLVSAFPSSIQQNHGRGSSYFYDAFWRKLCCLRRDGTSNRALFWQTHLGTDELAGTWVFGVGGVCSVVLASLFLYEEPDEFMARLSFLCSVPFGVGSLLFVRHAYPDRANSSVCCGQLDYRETDPTDQPLLANKH